MEANHFQRDTRDSKFVLLEHMDLDKLLAYQPFAEFSREDFAMIIERSRAFKVCKESLGPGMVEGDRIGCAWADGVVTTPPRWKDCWRCAQTKTAGPPSPRARSSGARACPTWWTAWSKR